MTPTIYKHIPQIEGIHKFKFTHLNLEWCKVVFDSITFYSNIYCRYNYGY